MSVGKGPEIVLSPPAVVTCDMVAALAKWVKADVQPLARTHLGSPIVKFETMSSYSCRNAYGRSRTNLSEHGRPMLSISAVSLRHRGTIPKC